MRGVLPVAPGARAFRPAPVSRPRRCLERSEARLTMHHRHHHHHHRAHHGGGHLDGGLDAERERCHAAIMHPDRSKGKTLFTFRNGAGGCAVGGSGGGRGRGAGVAGGGLRPHRVRRYEQFTGLQLFTTSHSIWRPRSTSVPRPWRTSAVGPALADQAVPAQQSQPRIPGPAVPAQQVVPDQQSQPSFPGPAMSAPAAQHQQGVLEVRGGAVG